MNIVVLGPAREECNGGSIYEHDRNRSACKECKGCSISEHSIIR